MSTEWLVFVIGLNAISLLVNIATFRRIMRRRRRKRERDRTRTVQTERSSMV